MDFPKIMEYRSGKNYCIVVMLKVKPNNYSFGFEIAGNMSHSKIFQDWNFKVFKELELKKCE